MKAAAVGDCRWLPHLKSSLHADALGASIAGMSINAEWHRQHPMPKNPTVEQRVAWHLAHQEHCKCRPVPAKLQELIAEQQESTSKKRARP